MSIALRIAGYQGELSVHTRAVRALIRALRQRSGIAVEIMFEPNIATRGRKVTDLLDLVAGGELDLCYFSSTYLSARVTSLGVFDVPFLFSDPRQTRTSLDSRLGAILRRDIAALTPYVALAFWDNGLRHISNARRAIHRPADCRGLRIRTTPSAGYHATLRALGMEPLTIDVGDMVRAIAADEVDAQENPLTNVRLFGLQKYHPHVTTTAHFQGIVLFLCNAQAWRRWPHEVRDALAAALAEATELQWRLSAEDDVECRADLTRQGVQIVDLDAAERAAFGDVVREVAARQRAALPTDVAALIGS